ncbi:C1 family peptidase [Thermococcus aggregans]|uniref:C1 family peptidase n=1 Tax=Thermococcus aggregans TaxID=110163 RepID=A0A9E7MWM9_THEAG|nr:C1 family peptidase [Thermococcus aggregans]USS40202.1 C1 family peptidase [Thermococcus aggregans]
MVPPKNFDGSVTSAEARFVAKQHLLWASSNIPGFEDWENAKLSQPVVYYFPNGTKSAYEFTVLVNGKPEGFILVAAQKYMTPILEFGKGEAPSKRLGRIGAARIKGFTAKQNRLLYYGGLSYSIELGNGKAVDIHGRQVPVPKTVKLSFSPKRVVNAWRALETSSASEPMVGILSDDIYTKIIPNVPIWTEMDPYFGDPKNLSMSYPKNVGPKGDPWDAWDGCTPIAAAQIIAYYEHPEIYENGYYTQEYKEYMTSLVDILHHTMGTFDKENDPGQTYWCGSWGPDACDGIEAFADEYQKLKNEGIVSWSLVHSYDAQPTCTLGLCSWFGYIHASDVINEVDSNHPILLQLYNGGSSVYGQGPYGNHSVVVVGYVGNSNTVDYLVIHSGWDMNEHYLAWGNWGSDTHLVKVIPKRR